MNDEALARRCRALKLLLSDVDGVMTDGTVLLLPDGREAKSFHIRDGVAVVLARRAGLRTGIITGRSSEVVTRRAAELGIAHVSQGVGDKAAELAALMGRLGVAPAETACVGDDTPDLPMLENAGLAIAVADAHGALGPVVHWVTSAAGGRGAVREVCDLLISARAP